MVAGAAVSVGGTVGSGKTVAVAGATVFVGTVVGTFPAGAGVSQADKVIASAIAMTPNV
jgi:hypothetical protein